MTQSPDLGLEGRHTLFLDLESGDWKISGKSVERYNATTTTCSMTLGELEDMKAQCGCDG